MPFELAAYRRTRPYAYHLTSEVNFRRIKVQGVLICARDLMVSAGSSEWLRTRRRGSKVLTVDGETVLLRDQDPLHEGNVALHADWKFGDYLEELNSRVFFWPGGANGPISPGQNHFARYADESPVILRVHAAELFEENGETEPEFARYNTGAPRCNRGLPSPRGPETFRTANVFDGTPSGVVELTYRGKAELPGCAVEWCQGIEMNRWTPM